MARLRVHRPLFHYISYFLFATSTFGVHISFDFQEVLHFGHSDQLRPLENMPEHPGYRSVAYYVNWAIYGRDHQPQSIPATHLTHVLYAFANVRPESGEVYLSDPWSDTDKHYPSDSWNDQGNNVYGCIKQIYLLKKQHRNLKVLLSIGGWTYSSNFPAPAATDSGRQTFAKSAVQLLKNLGLDGLDIDWEYPKSESEAQDFIKLLQATHQELEAYSDSVPHKPHFLLTVACPAGPSNYNIMKIREMDRWLDFWNLIAYDFAGSWDRQAGHMANLYPSKSDARCTPFDTDCAVQHYLKQGVNPSKIVLGMPLYGRAFQGTTGPGHSYNGVSEGSWENGVWDYKALPRPGAEICHDDAAIASWCYGPKSQTMVSYDTPQVASEKVQYFKKRSLGGSMWWETSGDKPENGSESLIKIVAQGLGGYEGKHMEKCDNVLEYPESKYDNLRKGMPGE